MHFFSKKHFFINEIQFRISIVFICFIQLFCICFSYYSELFYLITQNINIKLFIYTNLTEVFFVSTKLAIIMSSIFSFYILLLQIYLFLKNALFKFEKIFFLKLIFYIIFFSIITYTVTIKTLPYITNFFTLQENLHNMYNPKKLLIQIKIAEYLTFFIQIFLINLLYLCFLICFYIYFNHKPIYSLIKFNNIKKLLILCLLIISGIISPPDILSQIIFTVPCIILLELIFICIIFNKYSINWGRQDSNLRRN